MSLKYSEKATKEQIEKLEIFFCGRSVKTNVNVKKTLLRRCKNFLTPKMFCQHKYKNIQPSHIAYYITI